MRVREGERGKRAGGASIYQRRREVGGSMRRIAPYGRSLINSGRRQSRIRAAEYDDCCNRRAAPHRTASRLRFRLCLRSPSFLPLPSDTPTRTFAVIRHSPIAANRLRTVILLDQPETAKYAFALPERRESPRPGCPRGSSFNDSGRARPTE